jgi:adenylate kinase family enzyme
MGADKINSGIQEEVRRLRAENEMLRTEIQKKSEEETKIAELVKKSKQTWVRKQISNNFVDDAFDKLQSFYEKKLGIDDD